VVRRRGRPADSDGLTGQRILAAARECFAESGYATASTHMMAAKVGLTTGALYHHFGSKREIYLAVFAEAEELVLGHFQVAIEDQATFVDKVSAVLDETVRLSTADNALAGFIRSVTVDLARHPDLYGADESAWVRWVSFFAKIVDEGVANGEVACRDRALVLDTMTTFITGLFVITNGVPVAQTRAVKGFKRLLVGTLIRS
jgi:AcrR family transcriptional regulator